MKKTLSILTICMSAALLPAALTGCVDEPALVEDLNLSACLTPTSTSAAIDLTDGTTVTFTWSNSKGADGYVLEVFEGDEEALPETVFEGTPDKTEEIEASGSGNSSTKVIKLDRDKFFFARVKAVKEGKDDSKWAVFPYPIATYAVMEQIEGISISARDASSVTVDWTLEEGDLDVDQIRVYPNPDDASKAYKSYPVTASSGANSCKVDGLKASTRYTFALHCSSANRGEIISWTKPSTDGATQVKTDEEFHQAVKDGASEILLQYSDNPYTLYTEDEAGLRTDIVPGVPANGAMSIYGDGTPDGKMPVITGQITLPDGLTSFHIEGVSLSGDANGYAHAISFDPAFATASVQEISVLNCEIFGYKSGFFYDNTIKAGAGVTIGRISMRSIFVRDIAGDGGNGFDIRSEMTVNSIEVTESTFSNGFRTFFRIDKAKVNELKFNNNTVNNICFIENGNNKGVFYIGAGKGQVKIPVFEFKENLFLNMDGNAARTILCSDEFGVPTVISKNYYYKLGESFWSTTDSDKSGNKDWDQTKGLVGGSVILTGDPCVDSGRGKLNVTNAAVLEAKAGDPRWFAEYVPEPTPELVPVEYGHKWDLTDTYTFYETVEENTVRGNLRFFIDGNPVKISEKGMEFTSGANIEYSGIPTDCAMAFLVDGPGSIYISALKSDSGTYNDHITVALGSADGTKAEVKGAAFAGAENAKIVFADLVPDEPRLIYIYSCGPVVLSGLEWSDDTNTGSSALATPEVTATGADGSLSVSWAAVENAGKYIISFGKKEADAEYAEDEYIVETDGTSYSWDNFPSGNFTVNVQAVPAEPDKFKNSEIAGADVTVAAKAQTEMTSGSLGQEDFKLIAGVVGDGKKLPAGGHITYKNFMFTAKKADKASFGISEFGSWFSTGGSSTVNAVPADASQTVRFIAGGSGTLTVISTSTGSGSVRNVGYAVNGKKGETVHQVPDKPGATLDEAAATFTFEVTASKGDVVEVYGDANIYILGVKWTPAPAPGGIPSDPEAIEEHFDVIASMPAEGKDLAAAGEPVTIDKVTYAGKSGKAMTWDAEGKRIKIQGKSSIDDATGLPTDNYISFKVTGPGTISHYIRSGSGSDAERKVKIDLVMNDGGDIVNLYDGFAPTDGYSEEKKTSTAITAEQLAATTKTATVYIYAPTNSVNVYYLTYTPEAK